MKRFIKEHLKTVFDGYNCVMIGTGGTITNIASIKTALKTYKKEYIHGISITDKEIDEIIRQLKPLNVCERKNIIGLEANREDIILQGIILLKEIMEYFSIKEVIVSANGVRYGVLFERLEVELF
ncbi:MAG TPA: hypothetical protein PK800_09285 [Syntrophorhabdaceae bacterium]|nr:hypothetical protein [Syntrophorhabdaceae bacterium]